MQRTTCSSGLDCLVTLEARLMSAYPILILMDLNDLRLGRVPISTDQTQCNFGEFFSSDLGEQARYCGDHTGRKPVRYSWPAYRPNQLNLEGSFYVRRKQQAGINR